MLCHELDSRKNPLCTQSYWSAAPPRDYRRGRCGLFTAALECAAQSYFKALFLPLRAALTTDSDGPEMGKTSAYWVKSGCGRV